MIASKDAHFFGQAKNSWLTGTAVWTFVNVPPFMLKLFYYSKVMLQPQILAIYPAVQLLA